MPLKRKVRIEKSRYFNNDPEDDNYMHRIKTPVTIMLIIVLVAMFVLFCRLFGVAI